MGERGIGLGRRMKRLAFALLVVFALNAAPVAVERLQPEAHFVQAQTAYAKDQADKQKADKQDKTGSAVVTGDGGGY